MHHLIALALMETPTDALPSTWVAWIVGVLLAALAAEAVVIKVLFGMLMKSNKEHEEVVRVLNKEHQDKVEKLTEMVLTGLNNNTAALQEVARK